MNYFDMLDRGRKAAIYAYLRAQQSPMQNFGRVAAAGGAPTVQNQPTPTPEPTPAPTPEPDPTPSEPVEYEMDWELIHDAESWDKLYHEEGSPLQKYYEKYPEEDLWNKDLQRGNNFNDRHYEGTIDGVEVSCNALWATTASQKLVINGETYYCEIWSYHLDPKDVDLFYDADLSNSADKVFKISSVTFPRFEHCWEGAIHAADAKYPWVSVNIKTPHDLSKYEGKVEFQYNGNNYYPFGDTFNKFNGFGVTSLPDLLGINRIDPNNQQATDTFKKTDLAVKGYVKLD